MTFGSEVQHDIEGSASDAAAIIKYRHERHHASSRGFRAEFESRQLLGSRAKGAREESSDSRPLEGTAMVMLPYFPAPHDTLQRIQ